MSGSQLSVSPPLWEEISRNELRNKDGKIKLEVLLLHFLKGGRMSIDDGVQVVDAAIAKLRAEKNVIHLQGEYTVVGDLHGQFYDLAKIFKLHGLPPSRRYLFLGNYIGGGGFNCEMMMFLLAIKARYPDYIFMLRGPNESCSTSAAFFFEEECFLKYNERVFHLLVSAFYSLPLAAVVNKVYFCVHGGLSPDIEYIESIDSVFRFGEIPSEGGMCDLLWADPLWDADNVVAAQTSDEYFTPTTQFYDNQPDFVPNQKRGRSYVFNFACIKFFMQKNNFRCIIRSHEVEDNGYKLYRVLPSTDYPCMISIFSAPNYCGSFENMGAVATLGENVSIVKFFRSPCPYDLPKTNVWMWSIPFVIENTLNIFEKILGLKSS